MAILALDLGARRVGMAINEVGSIVTELNTLEWTSIDQLVAEIGLLSAERDIQTVVVGQPRLDSDLEKLLILIADRLSDVKIVQIDESLSTKEAERQFVDEGQRGDTDARAARILLEQYLEERLRP
jgi:putative transcription antitermination factor YqgF